MRVPVAKVIGLMFLLGVQSTSVDAQEPGKRAIAAVAQPIDGELFKPPLTKYVEDCKTELGFESIPQFSCEGIQFRSADGPRFINTLDFVNHQQINENVDAVFACRWVVTRPDGTTGAATGEMIVHNRAKGKTCFFQLKNDGTKADPKVASIFVPSPTDASAFLFWDTPQSTVEAKCTACHAGGPYIASAPIVSALAQYGLINDGHDVFGNTYSAVGSSGPALNEIAESYRDPTERCAEKCHLMGGRTPAGGQVSSVVAPPNSGIIVMPSINVVIDELRGFANPNLLTDPEHMPPTDQYSDYRWINRDKPNDKGDFERLSDMKREYPELGRGCSNPRFLQARIVDDTTVYASDAFVDAIDTFNVQDGLHCLNADQRSGSCTNYETRYRCAGRWRSWQSHDSPGSTGDHEPRSSYDFPSACDESPPTAIQARYYVGGKAHIVNGPPDRLAEFDENGLVCRNEDQPSGERCHNYTVRFICD